MPYPTCKHRLLIVDDLCSFRQGLKRLFVEEGFSVAEAASGTEALALLSAESFDVMLLDIWMPGMNGIEVMKRVHRDFPGTAVIVMTGHAGLDSAITAVRTGARDYIVKPFRFEDVLLAVSEAIQSRSAERERQQLLDRISQSVASLQMSLSQDQTPPPPNQTMPVPTPVAAADAPPSDDRVQIGDLLLEWDKRTATILSSDRPPVDLTEGEAALLRTLMQQADRVLSCEELASEALGYNDLEHWEAENVVRPSVFRLRRKVEDNPRSPQRICTVRGRGYFFRLPDAT